MLKTLSLLGLYLHHPFAASCRSGEGRGGVAALMARAAFRLLGADRKGPATLPTSLLGVTPIYIYQRIYVRPISWGYGPLFTVRRIAPFFL